MVACPLFVTTMGRHLALCLVASWPCRRWLAASNSACHGDALIHPLSSFGHARDRQAGTLPHSRHAAYWVIKGNSRLTIAAPESPQNRRSALPSPQGRGVPLPEPGLYGLRRDAPADGQVTCAVVV